MSITPLFPGMQPRAEDSLSMVGQPTVRFHDADRCPHLRFARSAAAAAKPEFKQQRAGMNETRNPKRQKVGMALYGDLTYDSRVRREAATLARAGYEVSLACLGAEGGQRDDLPADVRVLVLEPTATSVLPGSEIPFSDGRSGRLVTILGRVSWIWAYARNVRAWGRSVVAALGPQDIWHLHDLTALAAVAPRLKQHVPVIYDAHELYLDTGTF